MAAQAGGQQQGADNSMAMLWGIGLAFAVAWVLWYFFHAQIAGFILKLRIIEAQVIAWFVKDAQPLAVRLQSLSPANLQAGDIANISHAVGHYLRYPVVVMLLIFAGFVYAGRATLRFKKYYTMNSLVEAEKVSWLQITPVAPLNLIETDIDKGPWAMSLSPMQFAKQHRLMKLERVLPSVSTATTATGGSYLVAHLQREAARRTFVVQLGSYWEGTQALPSHTQALLAVFAARAARDREASNQLLLQIAASAVGNKAEDGPAAFISRLNFSGTDTLLKKYLSYKTVAQATKQHAYVLGVLASMLQLARQDGVLAAADFLWLKPADRPLWFMLNAIGRQTAFPEVAGPFAHWIAERSIGHKLVVPMVDTAVSALEIALKEVRLSEESLEGS